ncbi:hypothetical protein WR25_13645 [Diploscapter pachys]|uniref:TFIID subunit TAF5 NTD2 domain-containing protein n=1 Tax=Diploscapter pachys TaxID=2018661 RepID=A0A2A2KRJ5_9BILA|nr:hypothetical protein WR25_13645 [Diploscapter pachys]
MDNSMSDGPGNSTMGSLNLSPNSSFAESLLNNDANLTPNSLQAILAVLRKNGLTEAEEALQREASNLLKDGARPPSRQTTTDTLVSEFDSLLKHLDMAHDYFQAELSQINFPLFAHIFLRLLDNPPDAAVTFTPTSFYNQYVFRIPAYYQEQTANLKRQTTMHLALQNTFIQNFLKTPFVIRLSKPCLKQLEVILTRFPELNSLVKKHILIEPIDVVAKMKSSLDAQMGGWFGQIQKRDNLHKVYHAVHKDEAYQAIERRKLRGKEQKDTKKSSIHLPAQDRIPLPPLNERMREEKKNICKDAVKMTIISAEAPPSICMFTALNAYGGLASCDVSDDSSLLALGYGDSGINLFALDESRGLKKLRTADDLEKLDMDSDSLDMQLWADEPPSPNVMLTGHSGPIYSVNFSPDRRLLLSSSGDNTVRIWSLDTQRNVVVYRTPSPIWQAQFCNRGYYFCTGGADGQAALWCTERMHPLRLLPDSYGHVSCVDFHPNCNYIVGGSDDRYVRVWDALSGTCVRTLCGHKAGIRAIKCSPDGRYVVSMSADGSIYVWDIAFQRIVGCETKAVPTTMGSIAFSRDGGVFAASHGGSSVSIYSLDNLIAAMNQADKTAGTGDMSYEPKVDMDGFNLFSYPTKQSPIAGVHFTRRNLLLAIGSFQG